MASSNVVAVTGALGNLGWKLARCLSSRSQVLGIEKLLLLDLSNPSEEQKDEIARWNSDERVAVVPLSCDLRDPSDHGWASALSSEVTSLVHLAAQNPFPEATIDDCLASIEMTTNVAVAVSHSQTANRMVFASSNHVMGRYKDKPLSDTLLPGGLNTALPVGVGTIWDTGVNGIMDSSFYSLAKAVGERTLNTLAYTSPTKEFISVRIGWCQPGENTPATITVTGTPTLSSDGLDLELTSDQQISEEWYKKMWLSNRDFQQLFEKALFAPANKWRHSHVIVNGMSHNAGMKWSTEEGKELLGYEPQDDVTSWKQGKSKRHINP